MSAAATTSKKPAAATSSQNLSEQSKAPVSNASPVNSKPSIPQVGDPYPTSQAPAKPTAFYRLIGGNHVISDPSGALRPNGQPVDKVYKRGDVIESADNLVEKHPNKFERLHDYNPKRKANLPPVTPFQQPKNVEGITESEYAMLAGEEDVAFIMEWAENNDIDLKGETERDKVLLVIRSYVTH